MQESLVQFLGREDPLERILTPVFLGFPGGSDGKESTCNVGDPATIPGLGRFPGGGHGNPLQYSCLEKHLGQRNVMLDIVGQMADITFVLPYVLCHILGL